MRKAIASSAAICSGRMRPRSFRGWQSRSNAVPPSASSTRPSASTRVLPRNSLHCATNMCGRRRRPEFVLDFIDIKDDIEPLVAVVEAFTSATSRADRASLLAQIRDQLEKLRVADEKLQAKLRQFYEGTSKDGIRATEAEQAALVLREDESVAANTLRPR